MWKEKTSGHLVTQRLLWFGFLGSAIAWFVHLAVVYGIAEAICPAGQQSLAFLGATGVIVILVLITVAAALVCIASGLAAHKIRAHLAASEDIDPTLEARGAGKHMARGGIYLSIFFLFVIVMQLLPVFFMRPCP